MATQKEKLVKATLMANRIKNIANRLRADAKMYDVKFPLRYTDELENVAKEYLNTK